MNWLWTAPNRTWPCSHSLTGKLLRRQLYCCLKLPFTFAHFSLYGEETTNNSSLFCFTALDFALEFFDSQLLYIHLRYSISSGLFFSCRQGFLSPIVFEFLRGFFIWPDMVWWRCNFLSCGGWCEEG
jgi:hypothetical protein